MMNTDNPQEIGRVIGLAWYAAIVDGEGSVNLLVNERRNEGRNKNCLRVRPRINVSNTDAGIVERCVAVLMENEIGSYVQHTRPNNTSYIGRNASKDITYINVDGIYKVHKLLYLIRPYMASSEKCHRADLLLKFIDERFASIEKAGTARNLSYEQNDVDNILAFLAMTKCENIEHVAKILNDHTKGARSIRRKETKRRYGLNSREIARTSEKSLVA